MLDEGSDEGLDEDAGPGLSTFRGELEKAIQGRHVMNEQAVQVSDTG